MIFVKIHAGRGLLCYFADASLADFEAGAYAIYYIEYRIADLKRMEENHIIRHI